MDRSLAVFGPDQTGAGLPLTTSENRECQLRPCVRMRRMDLDPDACYRAVATRDARFDGKFFTVVWMWRDAIIRVISMRRSHEQEERKYRATCGGGT